MTIRQLQDKARSKRSILLKKSRIGLTRALRKAYGAVGSVQTKTRPSAFIPPVHMTDYQKKGGSCYSVGVLLGDDAKFLELELNCGKLLL